MDPATEFAQLQWDFVDPIQRRYEVIRPLVLFAEGTAAQRAQATRHHPDTVRRWLHDFRQHGMRGLWPAAVQVEQRRRGRMPPCRYRSSSSSSYSSYVFLKPYCSCLANSPTLHN